MGWGRGKQEQPWNRKLRRLKPTRTPAATEQQAAMADWQKTAGTEREQRLTADAARAKRPELLRKVMARPKVVERMGKQLQRLKSGGAGLGQPRDWHGRWTA